MPARAACLKAAGGQQIADARTSFPSRFIEQFELKELHCLRTQIAKHRLAAHSVTNWSAEFQSWSIAMVIASSRLQSSIKFYDLSFRGGVVRGAVRQDGNHHFPSDMVS